MALVTNDVKTFSFLFVFPHLETRNDIKAFKTNKVGHRRARKDSKKWIGNENGKSIIHKA